MLDCGFTIQETEARLLRAGLAPADLAAIIVTHEHGDHADGVFPFARRHGVPVWMTYGTLAALRDAGVAVENCPIRLVDAADRGASVRLRRAGARVQLRSRHARGRAVSALTQGAHRGPPRTSGQRGLGGDTRGAGPHPAEARDRGAPVADQQHARARSRRARGGGRVRAGVDLGGDAGGGLLLEGDLEPGGVRRHRGLRRLPDLVEALAHRLAFLWIADD